MSVPPARIERPATLGGAAAVVVLQGLAMIVFGILEVVHTSADNAGMAVTTSLFFVLTGVGLFAVARGLWQVSSWARGPIVAADVIQLLTAYSFLGGTTTMTAVVLAVVAVVGLGLLLHPASSRALAASPT